MEDRWYENYYDNYARDNSKTTVEVTPATCGHKEGDCTWDYCPICKKKTVHKYMITRSLAIVDVERCESLSCQQLIETTVKRQ